MSRILTDRQEELLYEERRYLGELQLTLARLDAAREDQDTLERSIRQLDQLFLVLIVGEFNAGKSTFINALLGDEILAEGVTPTTTRISLLRYGNSTDRTLVMPALEEIRAPADILQHLEIVDTPGTNSLERRHEAITEEFLPRADLVFFITSADRPLSESEHLFIKKIRQWGKKLVLVANKIDFLRLQQDVSIIEAFMRESAERILGLAPEIFSISAKQALEAKLSGDPEALDKSGFEAVESYLIDTLDENERVRLKLLNPLGIAFKLGEKYRDDLTDRDAILADDYKELERIDAELGLYKEDLGGEFGFRLSDVDNVLHELEARGVEFFDHTVRLSRIFDLLNSSRIQTDFHREVIADAPRQIEKKVEEIIDWLIGAELKQWQGIHRYVSERQVAHGERIAGALGTFPYDRAKLLENVASRAKRVVDGFDHQSEAKRLAESVRGAVAGTALLEAGAVGLGATVTALATTQLADVTGMLAAGSLAVLGLMVLPAKRKAARRDLARKIDALRERLMATLEKQFGQEVEHSLGRIRETMAPYTRFVRAERERLNKLRRDLGDKLDILEVLRSRIEEDSDFAA